MLNYLPLLVSSRMAQRSPGTSCEPMTGKSLPVFPVFGGGCGSTRVEKRRTRGSSPPLFRHQCSVDFKTRETQATNLEISVLTRSKTPARLSRRRCTGTFVLCWIFLTTLGGCRQQEGGGGGHREAAATLNLSSLLSRSVRHHFLPTRREIPIRRGVGEAACCRFAGVPAPRGLVCRLSLVSRGSLMVRENVSQCPGLAIRAISFFHWEAVGRQ